MVLNCGVVKTIESPLDCTRLNQSIERRSVLNIHWKDWCWSWNSNPLATWCEELTSWKTPWCWGRLKTGEGVNRGWDGWMASLTRWTWVRPSSETWWRTRKPSLLPFMGSQSQTWLSDWTELNNSFVIKNSLLHSLLPLFPCLPLLPDFSPDSFKTQNLFLKIEIQV